jgi:hypothetical protein
MSAEESRAGHGDVEIGKNGLRVSYVRFLSDSAAGYILLVLIILVLVTSDALNSHHVEKEIQIAILVLLTILASPIGLAVNALSWFTLGWTIPLLERSYFATTQRLVQDIPTPRAAALCGRVRRAYTDPGCVVRWVPPALLVAVVAGFIARHFGWAETGITAIAVFVGYPLIAGLSAAPTAERLLVGRAARLFHISDENWPDSKRLEVILEVHFPTKVAKIEYVTGGMIFLRSLAFLFFSLAIARVLLIWPPSWFWSDAISRSLFVRASVMAGLVCLWASALAYFYRMAEILNISWSLYDEFEPSAVSTNAFYRVLADDNLRSWIASGEPRRWVRTRRGRWDHQDWLALLRQLRDTRYWPMNELKIGEALEELKHDFVQPKG